MPRSLPTPLFRSEEHRHAPTQDTLGLIDEAIAHFNQALEALGQISQTGEQSVPGHVIAKGAQPLRQPVQLLRNAVSGEEARDP